VEINGESLADRCELQLAVSETTPSTVVVLTIIRQNRQDRIQVTLGVQLSEQQTSH
jgi:S1-C subfamily serine protease